jgi:hypothetical protein
VALVQRTLAEITAEANRQQQELTVGQILRRQNEPRWIAEGHGLYVRTAGVAAGDTYVGADPVSKWYDRNIRIFANLQQIARPRDRIPVIVGSSHAAILRELVAHTPDMVLVEAQQYLPSH